MHPNSFKRRYLSSLIPLLVLILPICKADENSEPPKTGNFILPSSQQPGPLIGLGGNIIDKNETQLFFLADNNVGDNKHLIDLTPSVLYGISNDFSIFLNIPYAASYKIDQETSRGWEDAFVQVEYAFYSHSSTSYTDQATILFNVTIPTGSAHKAIPTGVGSSSYFLGATLNRTYIQWLLFGASGAVFTTAKSGTKFGNSYLYQFGFGRNLMDFDGWIWAWMIETDGTYSQQNRMSGVIDPNSGSNVVYVTPSLWVSTNKMIFQLGIGFPAAQHLLGDQIKTDYVLTANIGWSIY